MERCKHDFILAECAECQPVPKGLQSRVFVTTAGQVFHKTRECRALMEGQAKARFFGAQTAEASQVPLNEARSRGLSECMVCFGGADPWFWKQIAGDPW